MMYYLILDRCLESSIIREIFIDLSVLIQDLFVITLTSDSLH